MNKEPAMSDLKLLPCPCCGSDDVSFGRVEDSRSWVICGTCGLNANSLDTLPEAGPVAVWNTRRTQPEATVPAQADERCPIVHGGSVEVAHLIAIAKATGLFGMASITDIKNYSIALLNEFAVAPAQDLSAGDIENTPVFDLLKRAIGVIALHNDAEAKAIAADARAILQSRNKT